MEKNNVERMSPFRASEAPSVEVLRILYAEDEELISSVAEHLKLEIERRFCRELRKKKRVEVELVKTVAELRQKLREKSYDLLILDCKLEDGSSCRVFHERILKSPVIITTGYANPDEIELAKRSYPHIKKILYKPYRLRELVDFSFAVLAGLDLSLVGSNGTGRRKKRPKSCKGG